MKDAAGGGGATPPIVAAPAPAVAAPATTAPAAGAQPPAPTDVTGGGPVTTAPAPTTAPVTGGGATTYEAQPQVSGCGAWVPAPIAPAPAPAAEGSTSSGDTPPEPVNSDGTPMPGTPAPSSDGGSTSPAGDTTAPDGSTAPASATKDAGTASASANWPQWSAEFIKLGLSAEEVAKIGAAKLTDTQLAEVYQDVHTGLQAAGTTPGQDVAPTGAPAWSPEWEQKFAALGLPPALVAEIKAKAIESGADEAKLQSVYDQVVAKTGAPAAGAGGWSPEWEQKFAALGLPAALVAAIKAKALEGGADDAKLQSVYDQVVAQVGGAPGQGAVPGQGAQDQPGWTPEWEARFAKLGMPKDVIKLYAESGAPASGLEAAFKHATERVTNFKQDGWYDKFTKEGAKPDAIWAMILADTPKTDKELEKALNTLRKQQTGMGGKALQAGLSLFPGGELLQYGLGKHLVTGTSIDRSSPMSIGTAVGSGLALLAAGRGVRTIGAGWAARAGGYAELAKVGSTTQGLGLSIGGASVDAIAGAGSLSLKDKIVSLLPGTKLHQEIVGLGQAEAAAKSFNLNAGKLMEDSVRNPDGALQISTLAQMFDDIKTGATTVRGGKYAYWGNIQSKAPMVYAPGEAGKDVLNVSKSLRIGDGRSQLVSMLHAGGDKLGKQPSWLMSAPQLIDDISALGSVKASGLGPAMAQNAIGNIGLGKDGRRPIAWLNKLTQHGAPEWYGKLARETAAQWPASVGGGMSHGLREVITFEHAFNVLGPETAAAIKALDRAGLKPEAAALVDETSAALDDIAAAITKSKAANAELPELGVAQARLTAARVELSAVDPAVAGKLFGHMSDDRIAQLIREGGEKAAQHAAGATSTTVDDAADAAAKATTAATPPAAGDAATTGAAAGARPTAAPTAAGADPVAAAGPLDDVFAKVKASAEELEAKRAYVRNWKPAPLAPAPPVTPGGLRDRQAAFGVTYAGTAPAM